MIKGYFEYNYLLYEKRSFLIYNSYSGTESPYLDETDMEIPTHINTNIKY